MADQRRVAFWRARARAAEERLAALDVALVTYCDPDPVTGDDLVDRALLLQAVQRRLAASTNDARIETLTERRTSRGLLRATLDVIARIGRDDHLQEAYAARDRLDHEIRQHLGIATPTMETNE